MHVRGEETRTIYGFLMYFYLFLKTTSVPGTVFIYIEYYTI
jgi:hypothetical protein